MVTLLSDKANTAICPVLAALHLVLRARCLLQPDSMPAACYLKKDALAYIIGSRIAILFRAAQGLCIRLYPKRRSSNILPTHCKSGLAFFSMRQANHPTTSRSAFVGWVTPFGCTCAIHASSRTSTARPYERRLKRSWI